MKATIIDGKSVALELRAQIAAQVDAIPTEKRPPCLAVIVAGDDPASAVYVRNKKTACEKAGIKSLEFAFGADVSIQTLLGKIEELNNDASVDGILVQSPLPRGLDERICFDAIAPDKDVDGFNPFNVGALTVGRDGFVPCTALGVMLLLEKYDVEINGKNCVVVGRSNIVGKPLASLLLAKNGTVTVCHSRTQQLASYTAKADILVAATGKARLITADMVKEGAVVIDVGITRTENGLVGDVDFASVSDKASLITPVPGGVGPMTIACLLENTLKAYKIHNEVMK